MRKKIVKTIIALLCFAFAFACLYGMCFSMVVTTNEEQEQIKLAFMFATCFILFIASLTSGLVTIFMIMGKRKERT